MKRGQALSDKTPDTPAEGEPSPDRQPTDPTAPGYPPPVDPYAPPPGHADPYGPPPADPHGHSYGQQPPTDPYGRPYGQQPPTQPMRPASPVPPEGHQVPPGWASWPGQQPPPWPGAPGHGPAGYGPPPGYYAGPDDPLVSADFGGWWRRGFTLLAATWRPMVLLQLMWVLPLLVIELFAIGGTTTITTTSADDIDWQTEIVEPLAIVAPFLIVFGLLSVVVQLATVDVLVQRALGRPVALGAALRAGLRRMLPLIGWEILGGLLAFVGLVFCILPGIYVVAVLMILPPLILLERGQGIGRAFQLFHADFGAALGRAATIVGLYFAFSLVSTSFSGALNSGGEPNVGMGIVAAIIGAGLSIATFVVISPLLLTAYADMRARREPFSTAYLAR